MECYALLALARIEEQRERLDTGSAIDYPVVMPVLLQIGYLKKLKEF